MGYLNRMDLPLMSIEHDLDADVYFVKGEDNRTLECFGTVIDAMGYLDDFRNMNPQTPEQYISLARKHNVLFREWDTLGIE